VKKYKCVHCGKEIIKFNLKEPPQCCLKCKRKILKGYNFLEDKIKILKTEFCN